MDYFFYNTDARSLSEAPRPRFPVQIKQDFAAVGGDKQKDGEQLRQLALEDILLMYEDGVGVVAVGRVLEKWDGRSHRTPEYYKPVEASGLTGGAVEYRIAVEWFVDLTDSPIGIGQLREQLGYTPRGTVRRIVEQRNTVAKLIEEWCAGLSLLPGDVARPDLCVE